MAKRPAEREGNSSSRTITNDNDDRYYSTDYEGYTPEKQPRTEDDGITVLTIEVAPSTKSRPPTLDEFLHRYGVNQDQLYKPCTRDIRVRVASLIKDWYKLGFCLLGFSRENWLKELKQDYVKNRLTHQRAEAVLDHWSEIEEEKATYNKLIKALMFCEERDIVQSVVKWISEMNISTRPVCCKLEALDEEFLELQEQLTTDLEQRHVSTDMLWNSLTMLPYKFRMEYESDIHTRLSELRGEERTAMLFRQLTPLFHFLDYDLLNHLINKFGSRNLKENMSKYLANIDKFMEETTVHDIIKVRYFRQPNENKFYKHYSKLRAKFDGDPKDYTLKKVDAVRTRFCDTARLSRTILWLMYCDEAQSFLITWCFPAVLAPDMKDRVTTLAGLQFFTSEHVSSVSVDGQVLYPAPPPRQEAARSCNIM